MSRRSAVVDRLCDGALLMYFAAVAMVALIPIAVFVALLEIADAIDAARAWIRKFR
jgi:hypothetical protein